MTDGEGRRARVDSLFAEALELPEAERAAFLARLAADEPWLGAVVEELLRLAAQPAPGLAPGALAGSPLWEDLAGPPQPRGTTSADLRIGAWRLVSELGSGGMGTVWLAERADGQYEQNAALKLLQPGPQTDALVRRFELERQILARLDHPHIARLLDGGVVDDGRPWFAMEYVDGEPIDGFCDARALPIDARLRLFIQVARAVQAAHGSLVVHRDLKPSNILVTREGFPRLLDFGIAKPLDAQPDPEAATRTLLVMTPEYASPEQVRGEPAMVASDVYQLGLLLYELLTGLRAQRLERHGPAELERVVCERMPPPPSAAVAPDTDRGLDIARYRRTTPVGLRRKLRGDLDAIVMKALRKEPERRYGSVAGLAEDIERYLQGLPVHARPETLGYRSRKFVRRHPVGTAAGAAFALLLLVYAVTVTGQARLLARERDQVRIEAAKAERVRDFLVGLFEAADPYGDKGVGVTAEELVAAGAEQIRTELDDEPEIRAEVLGVLGDVLMGLAAHDRAEDLVEEALALQRGLHVRDHPELAQAIARYGALLGGLQDAEAEERLAIEALEMRRRLHGEEHQTVAESLGQVAVALTAQARYSEAEATYREALDLRRRLGLEPDASAAVLWNDLGETLDYAGRRDEAEAAHRQALAIRRELFAPDHPTISESINNLALALSNQGRIAEAEPLYREALEIWRRALGDEHPRVAVALHNLGLLLRRSGKLEEAAASHHEALAIRRGVFGGVHSNTAMSLQALADVARDRGVMDEAEPLYREALAMFRDTVPEGHPRIGWAAVGLGRALLRQGQTQEAEPLLEEGLATLRAALGEDNSLTAQARVALGLCRAAQGRTVEARSLIEGGLVSLEDSATADPGLVEEAARTLAGLS
ncbi:MAG: tetratricopeptide repeat protein [Thermoanaerobaculia bacterium]